MDEKLRNALPDMDEMRNLLNCKPKKFNNVVM